MNDFRQVLDDVGCIWRHDPQNPTKPHAVLSSGRHTNGFVNVGALATHPDTLASSCAALANKVLTRHGILATIEWIVGPAIGGIMVAHEMARALGARSAFTEKRNGRMVLTRCRIPRGSTVLVCEDALTTGGTSMQTALELEQLGCNVVPTIATLVARRTGGFVDTPDGRQFEVVSLADVIFGEWDVPGGHACALCAIGSPAHSPNDHWDEFLAMD